MPTGQVLGKTARLAGEPVKRGVTFKEVYATLYRNLKIKLDTQRLFDFRGRPPYLTEPGTTPLPELV